MGTRIAALWKREKDVNGVKTASITGQIDCAAGINIPAGCKSVGVSVVPNEKHQDGDNLPHFYIEAWPRTERGDGAGF